jgi:hypothetical protein
MLERTTQVASPAVDPEHRLRDALRSARIESAERTGIVLDLHDAEVARLELLNEALDPIFADIPAEVDLFDRGISRGEAPRLWLDAVAHVVMSRDKRMYRFVQDTRYGRKVLLESVHLRELTDAITKYVAQRLIERERALVSNGAVLADSHREMRLERSRGRRRAIGAFFLGVFAGLAALVIAALLSAPR